MRKVSDKTFRDNQSSHCMFSTSCSLWDGEKCGRCRQATDNNTLWPKNMWIACL